MKRKDKNKGKKRKILSKFIHYIIIIIIPVTCLFGVVCFMLCKCYGQIYELISNNRDSVYLYGISALIIITLIICFTVIMGLAIKHFYSFCKEENSGSEILHDTYMEIFRPGYVHVYFYVTAKKSDCEEIYIVGSCDELGNWEPSHAKKLN